MMVRKVLGVILWLVSSVAMAVSSTATPTAADKHKAVKPKNTKNTPTKVKPVRTKSTKANPGKVKTAKLQSTKTHKKTKTAPKNYMYGRATYYGGRDGMNGRKMANGKTFNADNVNMAAHPTLPLGTKLKVTSISTKRSIYVEITDRMAKHNRVLDLSKGGAKALGLGSKGGGVVALQVVGDDEFFNNQNLVEVQGSDSGMPH